MDSGGADTSCKFEYRVTLHSALSADRDVLRSFSSEFEVMECWGYNRFCRLDSMRDQGLIDAGGNVTVSFAVRAPSYMALARSQQQYIRHLELVTQRLQSKVHGLLNEAEACAAAGEHQQHHQQQQQRVACTRSVVSTDAAKSSMHRPPQVHIERSERAALDATTGLAELLPSQRPSALRNIGNSVDSCNDEKHSDVWLQALNELDISAASAALADEAEDHVQPQSGNSVLADARHVQEIRGTDTDTDTDSELEEV
jgi:hypothetical protein